MSDIYPIKRSGSTNRNLVGATLGGEFRPFAVKSTWITSLPIIDVSNFITFTDEPIWEQTTPVPFSLGYQGGSYELSGVPIVYKDGVEGPAIRNFRLPPNTSVKSNSFDSGKYILAEAHGSFEYLGKTYYRNVWWVIRLYDIWLNIDDIFTPPDLLQFEGKGAVYVLWGNDPTDLTQYKERAFFSFKKMVTSWSDLTIYGNYEVYYIDHLPDDPPYIILNPDADIIISES